MALEQWKHQAILRKHIEGLGGCVELGTALVEIEQDSEFVTVKLSKQGSDKLESASFKYVVGADGGKSEIYSLDFAIAKANTSLGTVRKKLGLSLVGETRDEGLIYIADGHIEGLSPLHKVDFNAGSRFLLTDKSSG